MRKANLSIFGFLAIVSIVLISGTRASAQAGGGDVNQKPLTDFVLDVRNRVSIGQLDLSQKFSVTYGFVLGLDGRFDSKQSKAVSVSGDAKMSSTALAGIRALDESGYFSYLRGLGADQGKISVGQDGKNFSFVLKAEAKSVQSAQATASALNTFLTVGKMNVQNTTDRFILDNVRISPYASFVVLDFVIPASDLSRLPLGYKRLPLA